jgi:predicted Fe-Mo cluster-binding NifX family protein
MNAGLKMKIAIPTNDFSDVSGHAGQARCWLVFDCLPGRPPAAPRRITLAKEQVLHHFKDEVPHPLDGVEVVIAGSAGDGFFQHMKKRGASVLLTAEKDARQAIGKVLAGEALPDPRWDPSLLLCKLKDLFSAH